MPVAAFFFLCATLHFYKHRKPTLETTQRGNIMITKMKKHDNCEVETRRLYEGPHYAKLVCRDCKTWIQWLDQKDYQAINRMLYGGRRKLLSAKELGI